MSRPLVTYPRAVNVVVDFLAGALAAEAVEVSGSLPTDWVASNTPAIVVSTDATPGFFLNDPIAIAPTVRLVAWSNSPTLSHDLVMLAAGHMTAHNGEQFTARLNSGPLAAIDEERNGALHDDARLCAVTLRTRIRSTPIV